MINWKRIIHNTYNVSFSNEIFIIFSDITELKVVNKAIQQLHFLKM
jgi:hypothetical protein